MAPNYELILFQQQIRKKSSLDFPPSAWSPGCWCILFSLDCLLSWCSWWDSELERDRRERLGSRWHSLLTAPSAPSAVTQHSQLLLFTYQDLCHFPHLGCLIQIFPVWIWTGIMGAEQSSTFFSWTMSLLLEESKLTCMRSPLRVAWIPEGLSSVWAGEVSSLKLEQWVILYKKAKSILTSTHVFQEQHYF